MEQMKPIRCTAVIPFYNESRFLPSLIPAVSPYVNKIILINDGSTDSSLSSIPEDEKIILISYNKNCGKGYALNCGFRKSIELASEFTVTLDADMQHKPEYIPAFIAKISDYDVVIGNRLHEVKNMPFQRILSNRITSLLLSAKTGASITDSQCGYRAYRTAILKDILPDFTGFEAESEILVRAARKGYRIGSVNIPSIYADEQSKIKPMESIRGFLRVLFG